MIIEQYMVDAFADEVFKGNQAAVCITDEPLEACVMQSIACENNFSETAFLVPQLTERDKAVLSLRWFTPGGEIDLCGHATLASAFVVGSFIAPGVKRVMFNTKSGELLTEFDEEEGRTLISMSMPAYHSERVEVTDAMEHAFGIRPLEAWLARDLVCVLPDEAAVRATHPDPDALQELDGLLQHVTARADEGTGFDCVSRSFAPKLDVYEDPVCGSGHCAIVPLWARRLGKRDICALQASSRTGILQCRDEGDRVRMAGPATLYAKAQLYL